MNASIRSDDNLRSARSRWQFRLIYAGLIALAVLPPLIRWGIISSRWNRTLTTASFTYDPIYHVNAVQRWQAAQALFANDRILTVERENDAEDLFRLRAHLWNPREAAAYTSTAVEAVQTRIAAYMADRAYHRESISLHESVENAKVSSEGHPNPSYLGRFRALSKSPVPVDLNLFSYQPVLHTGAVSFSLALLLGGFLLLGQRRPSDFQIRPARV